MPQLIKERALADDRCTLVRDAATLADLPDGVPVIVPLSLWLERRARADRARRHRRVARAGRRSGRARGRRRATAGDRDRLSRSSPTAAAIRTRGCCAIAISYAGELRAIGDVARDQLYYLAQCGFDAFLIPDGRDAQRCARRLRGFQRRLPVHAARTPWFRRRQAVATPGDVWFPMLP